MRWTSRVGNPATSKLLEQQCRQTLTALPRRQLGSADWIKINLLHSDGAIVCKSFRAQRVRAVLPLLSHESSRRGRNSDFAALRAVGGFLRDSAKACWILHDFASKNNNDVWGGISALLCWSLPFQFDLLLHQSTPPPALLATPSIVPNQSFAVYRSCSLPQHDPPTYQLIRIDGFSVSGWSCSRIKPCQCHMINGSQSYQGGWISVLINARAQIPGFPPVDMFQIIFIEWAEELGWQRH